MRDRINRKITITIEGKDYDRLEAFEEEHEACLEKHPNMTGVQFELTVIPDGFGLFKTVTCVCGKSISLTDDYESFDEIKEDSSMVPKFQIVPDDPETDHIVTTLLNIKKRPGMYFGKDQTITALDSFLGGYRNLLMVSKPDAAWFEIDKKVFNEYTKDTDGRSLSDKEKFRIMLEAFETVLLRDFPEYANNLRGERND